MLLAIILTLFLGLLGLMAAILMTSSVNLVTAGLLIGVVLAAVLAVALDAAEIPPERRNDLRP